MIFKNSTLVLVVPMAFILSGCTSLGVFKESEQAAVPAPQPMVPAQTQASLAGEEDLAPAPMTKAAGLPAGKIRMALAGKTFRWKGPNNSGTTLFAQDGTSLLEVDGKGTAQGTWVARDGQLCETISPGAILPKGSPLKCNPFSGSGGTYKVGPATFRAS